MKFKNFYIWRKRLPHWRADGVIYYTTFRYRRDLSAEECEELLRVLLSLNDKKWHVLIACVLPNRTELMVQTDSELALRTSELSDILEPTKRKVGKRIQKVTGEKYSVFYQESFDRIVRDEQEFQERWEAILGGPSELGLYDQDGQYDGLWYQDTVEISPEHFPQDNVFPENPCLE